MENRVIPGTGYRFNTVWIAGIHRRRIWANLLFPLKMGVSLVQALVLLLCFRPNVVLGTGGYVSWPVLTAASILGRLRFIQEQNQVPGLVTRVLGSPKMSGVFLSFEMSKKYFKKQNHLFVCGNPTRILERKGLPEEGYSLFHLNPSRTTLFIFGGSQGARAINEAMLDRIEVLMQNTTIQILWAAGLRWYPDIAEDMSFYGERIRVMPYIDDMGAAYSVSDLVICRSGATTVAELTRLGKAAIFIPFPGAADNHQEANGRALAEAGAAVMVTEPEIESLLDKVIADLIENPQKRQEMGRKAASLGNPDAAQEIADKIIKTIQVRKGEIHEIQ